MSPHPKDLDPTPRPGGYAPGMEPSHEDEIMRRRRFIRDTLAGAGLVIASGVMDSAARLTPVNLPGTLPAKVAAVEETVHTHAMAFPTTPAVDGLPALLRDYTAARHVASGARTEQHSTVYGSMAYLAAFLAANLADQQDYDSAHAWYGTALAHAGHAADHEALGWIAGRAALMPWYRREARQTIHDAVYAVAHSPDGQLGTTLGNALAASTFARLSDRRHALQALDASERATERSDERFTAYSFPSYRWHKFASDVRTRLGDFRKARQHQEQALAGYPSGAVTDPTFVQLDQAEVIGADDARAAARHATQVVLSLAPERALPALLDRADEVADVIGTAGRDDTENLRHAVWHTRVAAGP